MSDLLNDMKQTVKYWWVSLLSGILMIILGVVCLLMPDVTLAGLSFLFIAYFFVSGILDIAFSVSNKDAMTGWGWGLAGGIFELVMAVLLITLPLPAITAMMIYLVGFWILFRSFWAIGESMQLQSMKVEGWGWLLFLAVLGVLFSFIYLLSPVFGGVFVVTMVCMALFSIGIYRIYLAFKLRNLHKYLHDN